MVLHVAAPFIRFQNGQCAHAVHRNGAHAANRRQWWGYRGKNTAALLPSGGAGLRPRQRAMGKAVHPAGATTHPAQALCRQIQGTGTSAPDTETAKLSAAGVLGAAPQRFGKIPGMAAARDTASIPLCSTAWNDARTTGQSCHVRLSDGICLPPIRLIYFIVSRPAGKMQLV